MIESNPVVPTIDPAALEQLRAELSNIQASVKRSYDTPYGALYAPTDTVMIDRVKKLVHLLETFDPKQFVLVGIGGSSMGALAALSALGGAQRDFICADTIDDRYTKTLLEKFRTSLIQGHKAIVCIVTKSGSTAETIINGALFLEVLKEFYPDDYQQYVVAITDTDSALYDAAQKEGFHYLEIPRMVGGRYSVFTPVGLFPLMMMGIDIDQLCQGAQQALRSCIDESIEVNESAQCALTLYAHYKKGYAVHNLFVFSPSYVDLAQWYKQLIGESLGKQRSRLGDCGEVGFTPLVSLGTTDLHSVVQSYLAGPRTMITSFIIDTDESADLSVPANSVSNLMAGMAGRTLTSVKAAIIKGTIAAFKKEQRPSLVMHLASTSNQIGAFFVLKMVETILLAKLFDIDPFDQPAVELYKQETRALLKN